MEIGPGEGVLTDLILNKSLKRLTAVELDRKLAMWLRVRHEALKHFTLIEGDILRQDITEICAGEKIRVIGNLPYNITSPIIFNLLDHRAEIQDITIMIQKEVAVRLASKPSLKAYGVPSILFQLYAKVEMLFDVSPNSFFPVPGVNSAVLRITFYPEPAFDVIDEILFRKLVKSTFTQRRKMLRNTLKPFVIDIKDSRLSQYADLRPEQLSIEQWAELSNVIGSIQSGDSHGN